MNEYEAHLSSYDHSHKQRLKDMKAMVRDPNAGARARKAEAKADGLVPIKLAPNAAGSSSGADSAAAGFKKGGFKKSGFKSAFAPVQDRAAAHAGPGAPAPRPAAPTAGSLARPSLLRSLPDESDTEDEGYERYDPRFPTD